jgi:CP family cyanate transporter-like MFS transporter
MTPASQKLSPKPSYKLSRTAAVGTLVALLLLAVNLRTAISSVAPVLTDIQRHLGLPGAAMGILMTLPVLCLGAFAAAAPPLGRRFGPEIALTGALVLITAGILVRLVPSVIALFAGTAIAGAGIAIGNVLMPYVIKKRFPNRVGLLTGLAMMAMSSGGAMGSGLAIPLDQAAGWQVALAVWAVPAAVAAAAWAGFTMAQRRRGHDRARDDVRSTEPQHQPRTGMGSLLRSPLAWFVTGFMGTQSLVFFVLMSWLPTILRDHGFSAGTAGVMLSTMMLLGIPTGLGMPILAARVRDQRPLVIVVTSLLVTGVGGLLLAPAAGWIWVVLLGVGGGSAFPLAFTLVTLRSPDPAVAAQLSGMAQTVGYLLAGAGPLAFRLLHDATSGWTVPLTLLVGWLLIEAFVALHAARPGFVGRRPAAVRPEEPIKPVTPVKLTHVQESTEPAPPAELAEPAGRKVPELAVSLR